METPDVVPKSFALMWGLDEGGTRGPKRGLSLDQVIDAAIEIADVEGVGALSMSRVAKRLGFTTMSLYRYVDSKDTLIELVLDRVVGLPQELPPDGGWRVRLERWAWAEFEMVQRHPWWVEVALVPPRGPNNMAWLDAGLAAFAGTAVPEPVKLQLVLNVSLYVIGRMRMAREMAADADYDDYMTQLGRVITAERYPALARAMSEQAFEQDEVAWQAADLRFGLDRLLDGYETFVRSFES